PDIYFVFDYFDAGTGTIALDYDSSTGTGLPAIYRQGGTVNLGNANTWKTAIVHVTDAWLANRQNGGADFRIGKVGGSLYIDNVRVTTEQPLGIICVPVTPNAYQ